MLPGAPLLSTAESVITDGDETSFNETTLPEVDPPQVGDPGGSITASPSPAPPPHASEVGEPAVVSASPSPPQVGDIGNGTEAASCGGEVGFAEFC